MGKEDRELVRAAQQGAGPEAETAFADLVDRWKVPLFRFLYARLRQAADADALAFEAFFEAWKSLPSLRGEFRPWLFGIAWNVLAGHFRKKGMKVQPTPVEQALLEQQEVLDDPAARIDLREAVGLLPPAVLRLLREKFEEGKSYRELEDLHGIAASTLRDHMTQALDRLEAILKQKGYLERFRRRDPGGTAPGAAPAAGGGP